MSNPRLSIIPAGAVTDRSLEPRDLQTLCLLGRHTDRAGWCVRSQVRMASELGCGRASVQRSLERLYDAGWVEKKRRDQAAGDGHPSASYAYRVVLDRDDFAFENATRDADGESDDSYADSASEQGGCPPVGTPPAEQGGARLDGHPGAQPCVGTGAHPYVGTKNDPLERPHLEREREARARDRKARFLANFEMRWPTAAADDRQRTAYAAEALTEAEEGEALAGIGPFLERLKRLKRTTIPAGFNYLEQKRWKLLSTDSSGASPSSASTVYARHSAEARALAVLHEIAAVGEGFRKIYRSPDGSISYRKPVTPRLAALAQAPPAADWPTLSHQQAVAWEHLLRDAVTIQMRKHLREGDRAPWTWPPSKDGKIYTDDAPREMLTDQDADDFANEGQ